MFRRNRRSARAPGAFADVVAHVEAAKRGLLTAVPSPRGLASVQPAEALLAFESELREAAVAMDDWRRPKTEEEWTECAAAIGQALRLAERARLDAPVLDYEGLVALLGDLISPLEAFARAERRLASST